MSGPTKFLTNNGLSALIVACGIIAWNIGGGLTSTMLVWHGALGMVAFGLYAQSNWPRDSSGGFVGVETALLLADEEAEEMASKRPPIGAAHRLFRFLLQGSVYAALALGLVVKCAGH